MRTIKLILEYDGTGFQGWQIQRHLPDERTVQGVLQKALAEMCRAPVRLKGASRTDAGVHARGQVAVFTTDRDRIPLVGFERGLTRMTPKHVCVRRAEEVEPGWDPKRTARGKRYVYTIWNDRNPSALDRDRAWWVTRALDLDRMRAAAAHLVGSHDFEAFRSASCVARHAHRRIYGIEVRPAHHRAVQIEVVGNAFVKNMVRIIAGNLAEVGYGAREPDDMKALLASRDRTQGGVTAPGHGLCLEEVIYDERLPPRPKDDADLEPGDADPPGAEGDGGAPNPEALL